MLYSWASPSPAPVVFDDFKDDGIGGVGVQLPSPSAVWKALRSGGIKPFHWRSIWLPLGPLMKMPHTDDGETSSRRYFNHRPRPSSPDNKILRLVVSWYVRSWAAAHPLKSGVSISFAINLKALHRRFPVNWRMSDKELRAQYYIANRSAYVFNPVMTYAAPPWAFMLKSNVKRLQAVQNRALIMIWGFDKIYSDLEIIKLESFLKHLAFKLYASAINSRNRYIKNLGADSSVGSRRVANPVHILD